MADLATALQQAPRPTPFVKPFHHSLFDLPPSISYFFSYSTFAFCILHRHSSHSLYLHGDYLVADINRLSGFAVLPIPIPNINRRACFFPSRNEAYSQYSHHDDHGKHQILLLIFCLCLWWHASKLGASASASERLANAPIGSAE